MRAAPPRRRALPPLVVTLCVLAPGCAAIRSVTSPEGDGGWSRAEREAEIARRASAAGVTLAVTPLPPAAPTPALLDLPAALALAQDGNRRIAAAQQRLAAAAEQVAEARGRLLPATTVTGQYTRHTAAQFTDVELPASVVEQLGGDVPDVEIRPLQAGVFNATTLLPLDLSGEIRATLAPGQAGYRGERARLWATTLEQQLLVVQTYFRRLQAMRLREVAAQSVALYRQQVADAEARFRNGRVTKNEYLIVEVALRNAEQHLRRRELAMEQARWRFNDVIGAAVNAATAVADVRARPTGPGVDEALRLSHEHNPVVQALLEEQQRLDATVRSLERSRFPRFSAGGAFDYSTSDIAQPQHLGSGFAGFTWDLGTDTRRAARIAEARAAADQNRLVMEGELRQIESAIRTAHDALLERLTALSTAEVAVGQAEENLRIRRQQFDLGRAQSDDVLRAETLLSQQRAVVATALYEAYTRRAELQRLIGLPIADGWAESPALPAAAPERRHGEGEG